MADHPTLGNGKICYIEIPADDINISSAFYQKVFDWNIRKRSDGSIAFDDGVGEVSGTWVSGRKPATEIGFVIYIMVYDIRESVDLIVASGGKVIELNLEGKDKLAKFSDPFGNIFGLYQQTA